MGLDVRDKMRRAKTAIVTANCGDSLYDIVHQDRDHSLAYVCYMRPILQAYLCRRSLIIPIQM